MDPKTNMTKLVFNSKKWNEAGGDVGDNSVFWEPAEIQCTYNAFGDGELVARVRWPDGTETRGHIISCMKEISDKINQGCAFHYDAPVVTCPSCRAASGLGSITRIGETNR